MTAARTIPDIHKRRTCMALIMSYNIVATKALLWRSRTTPNNKLCESAKLSTSTGEDQFALYCCSHCLPPRNLPLRNLEHLTLALASGRSSLRSLA